MAIILAIESCTGVCSVSILDGTTCVSRFVDNEQKSSSLLLPLCDEVLIEANIKLADVEYIAYTKGPGAFSGVRLCVGIAQGLALANNIKTIGISTLEVLAFGISEVYGNKNIIAALDARMGEVYWCQYQNSKIIQQALNKPTEIPAFDDSYLGAGSAWDCYGDDLLTTTKAAKFINNANPYASYLAQLAAKKYLKEATIELAMPLYLRNNVAKKAKKI